MFRIITLATMIVAVLTSDLAVDVVSTLRGEPVVVSATVVRPASGIEVAEVCLDHCEAVIVDPGSDGLGARL
jgi:anti-sigma-K factor RskA